MFGTNCSFVCQLFSGIKKKLQAAAQLKGCEALKGWVASIINHLYWSVVSSPPHDGELVVDKWKSVVYHIQNQHHSFPGRFERCAHPHLEKQELLKAWLLPCKFFIVKDTFLHPNIS